MNTSLRIAILGTRGIPNHYGGFEQLAEHLAPGLVQAGHDVTVYNSHNHPCQKKEWKGVCIRHCYDPEYLIGSAGQFVYDLNCILDARKMNYDVILQLGYTSSSVWGPLFPEGTMVLYNLDGLEWKRTKYSGPVRRFLKYAEKLAVKYSDFTIADSPVIQSYFREKYGIESEYIAYGAELFGEPGKTAGHGANGVSHEINTAGAPGDYFLLMARMERENNIDLILEGFHRSGSPRKFIVVGNVSNGFGKQLTTKYRKDDRIQFTGTIYDQKKVHALRYFSRMYFHGHSTGGTNPSLLEAMGSGVLIAAHNNAFNRQVLGKDAFYFNSEADITRLVDLVPDREREEKMICHNRKKVQERFNWPAIIAQYEQFILQSLFLYNNERNIPYRRYSW